MGLIEIAKLLGNLGDRLVRVSFKLFSSFMKSVAFDDPFWRDAHMCSEESLECAHGLVNLFCERFYMNNFGCILNQFNVALRSVMSIAW